MADATILHNEKVIDGGNKARWPYTQDYVEPTKDGYMFKGWKYDGQVYSPPFNNESTNPFGPITQDTVIRTVWDKVSIFADVNHSIISGNGDTDTDLTKLYSWIKSESGTVILNDIVLEEVPLDSGMQRISFEEKGSGVEDNKNVTKKKALPNTVNIPKYYRFKAKTDKYGGLQSNVIEIQQAGVDQTVLPDFDFLTFKYTWSDDDGKDLDTATFVLGTEIEILNGYYVNKENRNVISKNTYDGLSEEEKIKYEPEKLDYYPVGFNCNGVMGDKDYTQTENPIFDEVSQYIKGGGDNLKSGNESALINWKELCNRDFISEGITKIYCKLYANWYGERKNGNCQVTFQTWKTDSGTGGMKLDRDSSGKTLFTFSPTGDTVAKDNVVVNGNVYASSSLNSVSRRNSPTGDERGYYSHVITLTYDIRSKSALITERFNSSERGRNLRLNATVNGINNNIDGKTSYTYSKDLEYNDLTTQTVTFDYLKLYVNGSEYDVRFKYTITELREFIKYYYSGDVAWFDIMSVTTDSEGYVTSLTCKALSANTESQKRNADITIPLPGKESVYGTILLSFYQKVNS